jgi:hypothetical protein
MKVRGINEEELKLHIKEAFEIWEKRNTVKWIIDTSIISDSGFKVVCSKY